MTFFIIICFCIFFAGIYLKEDVHITISTLYKLFLFMYLLVKYMQVDESGGTFKDYIQKVAPGVLFLFFMFVMMYATLR